mmetsp:Transcript_34959/g.88040  ORF Transcript_34959/g.88040 Transcript_34959/m.88040 type:complete len:240 (+) Transcript_34959:66-785(+)
MAGLLVSVLVLLPFSGATPTSSCRSSEDLCTDDVSSVLQLKRVPYESVPCVYVNLASRTDRRNRIEAELSKAGLHCHRINAVDAKAMNLSSGHEGCRRSHIAALQHLQGMLEASRYNYGIVFEDDAVWRNATPPRALQLDMSYALQDHPVLLLSCNGYGYVRAEHWLKDVGACQTTSAYALRQDYIPKLKANMEGGTVIDQDWQHLQKTDRWVMYWPTVIKQGASWSDIQHGYADYDVF